MKLLFEFIGIYCTGLFAGAALYVTLVEHPARLECGTELAVAEFAPSYRRGAVMQALLGSTRLSGGSRRLGNRFKVCVAGWRNPDCRSHSFHVACNSSHKQEVARSVPGSKFGLGSATFDPLGKATRGPDSA
jgi:hypothetical protein